MKRLEFTDEFLFSLPSTLSEALKINSKYYFNNIPCLNGHLSPRIVSGNRCFLCKREDTRKSAERRRRRLGIKILNSPKPLLAGETYGALTATGNYKSEVSKNRKKNSNLLFNEVVCTCGNKFWQNSFLWQKSKQCSKCALKRMSKNNVSHGLSYSIEMSLWASAKSRAKKNNLEFNLKIEELIIPEKCPILGIHLDFRTGMSPTRAPRYNAPSIDRINPALGYLKDNIIIMSYKANVLKKDGTSEEHLKVAEFLEKMGIAD
jgi:hypothetical protein